MQPDTDASFIRTIIQFTTIETACPALALGERAIIASGAPGITHYVWACLSLEKLFRHTAV
ncbi:hypothetical protein ACFL47_00415 [Candidatus Latescibacterota bacterium]